jgi:hypothetical protein
MSRGFGMKPRFRLFAAGLAVAALFTIFLTSNVASIRTVRNSSEKSHVKRVPCIPELSATLSNGTAISLTQMLVGHVAIVVNTASL